MAETTEQTRTRIDEKFHTQDGKVIKTSNGESVPPDEPLFLLRGRDRLALVLLRVYEQLSIEDGCNEYHMKGLARRIKEFERFSLTSTRMKQPGVTKGL